MWSDYSLRLWIGLNKLSLYCDNIDQESNSQNQKKTVDNMNRVQSKSGV